MAYWFSFAAVAGAFGGLIAFGIQQVHASVANWRLLFITEVGPPTSVKCPHIHILAGDPNSVVGRCVLFSAS